MSYLQKTTKNSSAPRKKPIATAGSATTPAASTRKRFGKFQLPDNGRVDTTLVKSGTLGIIGNPFPKR
jgi:hypothetical protein